jgi:hypothetical protein
MTHPKRPRDPNQLAKSIQSLAIAFLLGFIIARRR